MTNTTKQPTAEDNSNNEPKLVCVGECGAEVDLLSPLCDECKKAINLFHDSEFDIGNQR